jgi:hypothetical protein
MCIASRDYIWIQEVIELAEGVGQAQAFIIALSREVRRDSARITFIPSEPPHQ